MNRKTKDWLHKAFYKSLESAVALSDLSGQVNDAIDMQKALDRSFEKAETVVLEAGQGTYMSVDEVIQKTVDDFNKKLETAYGQHASCPKLDSKEIMEKFKENKKDLTEKTKMEEFQENKKDILNRESDSTKTKRKESIDAALEMKLKNEEKALNKSYHEQLKKINERNYSEQQKQEKIKQLEKVVQERKKEIARERQKLLEKAFQENQKEITKARQKALERKLTYKPKF